MVYKRVHRRIFNMPKVLAFIETVDSSGVIQKQEKVPILSSIVKREGKRAVDTAQVTVSGDFTAEQKYNLRYLQDIADLSSLKGIWNFQHSGRDEAGFEIFDNEVGTPTYVLESATGKFKNRYVVNYDGSSDYLEYVNPTEAHPSLSPNVLDFTGQFDIYIWFKRITGESSNSEHCLFSKWDTAGAGNGIEIFYKVLGTTDDEIIVRDRTAGVTGSDITYVNNSGDHHGSFTAWSLVRVHRDNTGTLHISVGGTNVPIALTEMTTSSVSGDLDNTENLLFGKDKAGGSFTKARVAQTRVYSGGTLSDSDAAKIYGERPQFFTQKLYGTVWKVDDKINHKTLHVKGKGKLFLDILVDSKENASGIWADPAATWELTTRTVNLFENQDADNIIHDMVRSADTDYRIISNITSETVYKFIAEGKLGVLIRILNFIEGGDVDFFTYPHKVMILETAGSLVVNQEFIHGERGVTIAADKKDDTKLINDITIVGTNLPIKFHESQMAVGDSQGAAGLVFDLTHNPIGGLRVDDTGVLLNQIGDDPTTSPGAGEYQIDVENATLTLGTALTGVDTLDIEYEYEATNILTKKDDTNSKTEYGVYAKKLNVPQIRSVADIAGDKGLETLATRFIALFKDVDKSYTVRIPTLVNSVREGNGVYIANPLKAYNFTTRTLIDQEGGTIAGTTSDLAIKSIEWRYPEAVTILKVGEFEFDYYETLGSIISDVDTVSSTTTKYKGA